MQTTPIDWNEVAERLRVRDGAGGLRTTLSDVTAGAIPTLLRALQLEKGQQLLEIGCGQGDLLAVAMSHDVDATGIDIAPAMVRLAEARHSRVRARVADALHLPFDSSTFDAVACNFTLALVADPLAALAEAHRVLRPGGRFAMTTWELDREGLLSCAQSAVRRLGTLPSNALQMYACPRSDYVGTLGATGFTAIAFEELTLTIRCARPDGVLDVLATAGAVRALVESQEPSARRAVEQELVAQMRASEAEFEMAMPAVLFSCESSRKESGSIRLR